MSVKIIASKDGAIFTPFKNKPESGYVKVQELAFINDGSGIKQQKRTALLSGKLEALEGYISYASKDGITLPGKIVVIECVESDIHPKCISKIKKDVPLEVAIESFIKRPGENGPDMLLQGERILRFSFHDESGKESDIVVHHDNIDEVRAWSLENNKSFAEKSGVSETASFPK